MTMTTTLNFWESKRGLDVLARVGMPEWKGGSLAHGRFGSLPGCFYLHGHAEANVPYHVAASIIRDHLRAWLRERGIDIRFIHGPQNWEIRQLDRPDGFVVCFDTENKALAKGVEMVK
jgi:hypothetical protein